MAEFNIDDILSDFKGTSSPKSKSKDFDIDAILSDFNVKEEKPTIQSNNSAAGYGLGPPEDRFKPDFGSKDVPVTRRSLPTTNIGESIVKDFNSGRNAFSEGLDEIADKKPASGVGKAAMGALGTVFSPVSGLIEGGVTTPVADITGSKNIGERAGAITGLVTPVPGLGSAGSAGLNTVNKIAGGLPILNKASSYSKNKALSTLVENIGRENLAEHVATLKGNPRLASADLSPRVLQDVQHLFTQEGPQIDYLAKTSGARMANSKNAVIDAYDTSGGVSPDLASKVQSLAESAKKIGNEKIQPAIKGAKPVDITNTLRSIDEALKPGVNSVISAESTLTPSAVKEELAHIKAALGNDKEMRTKAEDLHKFQSGLRTSAETYLKSPIAADKEMGKALMNIRNNLVADIDKASPRAKATPEEILKQSGFSDKQISELGTGKLRDKTIEVFEKANGGPILSKDRGTYKEGLSHYRDEMHIADSFRDGYEGVFSSSKKMENDPSFTKQWFDGLTDAEKQAAREGARARIATEIGSARNPALAGESFSRSDFNQEKLATLFGKEEAAKLVKTLEEERKIANTHNKIVEGSQTAMRGASKSQFALPTATEVMKSTPAVAAAEASNFFMGGTPGVGTGLLATAKAGAMAKDAIKMKLAREHNARYAQYALPTEGPNRDALIAALESQIPGPKPSLVTRGANALSRIVAP
jgi:hypothetical protein